MDAREQPPLAPFVLLDAGGEASAQGKSFGLECRQGGGNVAVVEPEGRGERVLGRRPLTFEPAAQDFDKRRVALPLFLVSGRRDDWWVEF